MQILFLDIETIPCENPADVPPVKAPSNYKDPEKIAAYIAEHAADAHRSTSLDPLLGRILCIGYAVDGQPVECTPIESFADEAVILCKLDEVVRIMAANGPIHFCGHNLAAFDLPFLWLRAVKYGFHDLARRLPYHQYQRPYLLDTMIAAGGPSRDRFSLDKLARYFGIGAKSEGISGREIWEAYKAGRAAEIAEYCKHDVDLTRKLFNKIEGNQ